MLNSSVVNQGELIQVRPSLLFLDLLTKLPEDYPRNSSTTLLLHSAQYYQTLAFTSILCKRPPNISHKASLSTYPSKFHSTNTLLSPQLNSPEMLLKFPLALSGITFSSLFLGPNPDYFLSTTNSSSVASSLLVSPAISHLIAFSLTSHIMYTPLLYFILLLLYFRIIRKKHQLLTVH